MYVCMYACMYVCMYPHEASISELIRVLDPIGSAQSNFPGHPTTSTSRSDPRHTRCFRHSTPRRKSRQIPWWKNKQETSGNHSFNMLFTCYVFLKSFKKSKVFSDVWSFWTNMDRHSQLGIKPIFVSGVGHSFHWLESLRLYGSFWSKVRGQMQNHGSF